MDRVKGWLDLGDLDLIFKFINAAELCFPLKTMSSEKKKKKKKGNGMMKNHFLENPVFYW